MIFPEFFKFYFDPSLIPFVFAKFEPCTIWGTGAESVSSVHW